MEIVTRYDTDTFRAAVYTREFTGVIYVQKCTN